MANTLRIKRRAAGGAAGAPASMANAELAFNEQDNILYYGWGTGGAGGTATQALAIGGPGAFQAVDADLTAIAALSTTGLAVRTAANTWALRSITAPAAGITITNGDGVSGNPTLALANDLAALEGLSTTGLITRTADGAATTRSIAGTAGNITVSNGSGVAGNPTINLATVGVNVGGTLSTTYVLTDVAVDTYGRVNSYTNINLSDISLDQFKVPQANLSINSKRLTNLADPVNAQDAATKAYVDATRSGLDVKQSCRAASTTDISFGAGNETTIGGAPLSVDGVTLVAGNRVLVKDQSNQIYNGIWEVVTPGTGSNGSWTRPADFNGSATVTAGAFTFVAEGTVNADSGWVLTTNDTITWGTTGLTFAQFSGAGQITAGAGLTKSGNTLDINVGSGANSAGLEIASDQLKVKLGAHLAFNGTTGAVDVQTGTSGAAIPLLNGVNTWSAQQTLTAGVTQFGPLTSNSSVEINTFAANYPVIDFHCSNTVVDFNARIAVSGSTAGVGEGIMQVAAAGIACSGYLSGTVLYSTVATNTAPLNVNSTTRCINLNADLLDGYHVGEAGATIPLLNGNNTWSGNNVFLSSVDEIASQTPTHYPSLEVRQTDSTKDAYMAFHVAGTHGVYFGLDAPSNRLCTAGWSLGTTKKFILNDQDEIDCGTF